MLQLKVTQILQYLPNYLSNQFLLSKSRNIWATSDNVAKNFF